jgi:hypothetical protein
MTGVVASKGRGAEEGPTSAFPASKQVTSN